MLIITYGPEGNPVNDFEVEDLYEVLRAIPGNVTRKLTYSTANIFNRVRLGIAQNEVSCQEVVFMFDGESVAINEYGACLIWPRGFLDKAEYSLDILTTAMEKWRSKRR